MGSLASAAVDGCCWWRYFVWLCSEGYRLGFTGWPCNYIYCNIWPVGACDGDAIVRSHCCSGVLLGWFIAWGYCLQKQNSRKYTHAVVKRCANHATFFVSYPCDGILWGWRSCGRDRNNNFRNATYDKTNPLGFKARFARSC